MSNERRNVTCRALSANLALVTSVAERESLVNSVSLSSNLTVSAALRQPILSNDTAHEQKRKVYYNNLGGFRT